jgi:Cys-tRNA(Pro)/Cys-tRNA(Cys) deacylase
VKNVGKTPAARLLDGAGIPYTLHPYEYRGHGEIGLEAAAALGLDPKVLFKAVVFESASGAVLAAVPSDMRVAPGKLMKVLGQSARAAPVAPARAQTLTGYMVGGISPFALRRQMHVCVDASALSHMQVYVNAGRRGLIISLSPKDLAKATDAVVADIVEDTPPR